MTKPAKGAPGNVVGFPIVNRAPPDPPPGELIPEDQVLIYRPALAKSLLLGARKGKKIAYTTGKRGTIWYKLPDVDAYLKTRETQPCLDPKPGPSLNSEGNESQKSQESPGSTVSGLTKELAEHVALRSAQQILSKQKSA